MKKLLILLPALLLVLAAGVAFSKPEPAEKEPPNVEKRIWAGFPRSGMRLGVILSDEQNARDAGVRVERVIPDSPAERAGLKKGDVLLSLDGEKVSNPSEVRDFLRDLEEEKEVQVEILRDGDPMTIQITPEEQEGFRMMLGGNRMYLGINLQELDSDLASYFKVDPGAGVLVTRVESGSPAEKAGVRSGDVITHVNGEKINEPADVVRKMENLDEGATLEITVLRHGSEKKLTAKPEQRDWPHPDMPNIPELRNMLRDNPEFKENMQDLRREMDKMRQEMQIRKEDLMRMKDEIQKDVRREMEKLRQELKERKDET